MSSTTETRILQPVKRLLTAHDMEIWVGSETLKLFVDFITELSISVKGRTNQDLVTPISESIESINNLIDDISVIVDNNPVAADNGINTSRFGKIEFKSFYDAVEGKIDKILRSRIPGLDDSQYLELKTYLINSFGDRQRIDYGSGHELNFMCFLYVLYKYNILKNTDFANVVLMNFISYLKLMRKIEKEYWLEPAGSHGVWGLDDYHFLPFLFGASQVATHKHLKPKSIHNEEVVEMFADKYMYFGCINFINSVKTTASLKWHSPMLDDISGAKSWQKIADGMIKMYKAEVLSKLPIMQHFFFGETIKCPEGITEHHDNGDNDLDDCGHNHQNRELLNTWGDCCGIKIPSAIAATALNNKASNSHKTIPFD
ncbi:hypothetical protein FOG51_00022 [Hanseniaspora uvarum]|uniref:Serine/threonine-protein phosphatase 2A activator n=1 Tax=Hanseniaspora uvarum TaxID=29833 RepID=A0A1E5RJM6_HANUV|nr:hypothetical protein FOG48_01701 [Hanseniaspora uvarum]KAF0274844.1 hypothetical protein FOG51_00022 [Hanseniaspora uvarum]KAF0277777.1 hypothetical protein FOG50_01355 [Hanseniaspora uvarum]KKA01300.1 Serine/threonine-protein phosphatase 2A activator 2 [Hanseniaspora uvarum DSM 2768]OEJ86763.1 Serine/threonine-protein phosphatase 2A activator 2 [Hanseniaspora uvarum]